MRLSVRLRLLLFAVPVILVIAGITAMAIFHVREVITSELRTEAGYMVEYTYQLTESYISNVKGRLENLAGQPDIVEALKAAGTEKNSSLLKNISDEFTAIQERSTVIENIGLQDMGCIPIVTDKKALAVVGMNFSQRDYCRGVINAKAAYISGVFMSNVTGNVVIAIAVPVKDESDSMTGFIIATINLNDLFAHLSGLQKDDSYSILLDRYGTPFLYSEHLYRRALPLPLPDNIKDDIETMNYEMAAGKQEDHVTHVRKSGEGHTMGFKKFDYVTVLSAPSSIAVSAALENIVRRYIYVGIAGIMLAIISILLLSETMIRPIRKLTHTVDEITRGKLEMQLEKSSIAEIEDLNQSLNRILTSLKLAVLKTGLKKSEIGIGEIMKAKEEAEKKLKTTEERYEALVQNSPDCIKLLDKDGKIVFMNNAGLKEHRFSNLEQAMGWDIVESIVDNERQKVRAAIADAFKGKSTTIKVKHTEKGSTRKYCLLSIIPIKNEKGEIANALGISRDISEIEAYGESIRKKNEELERFARLVVGREEKMIEMKKRIGELEQKSRKR